MQKIVSIEATTLPDAWFQLIYNILEHGRDFTISQGSFAGSVRKEFDFVMIHIKRPFERDLEGFPLVPEVPEGSNLTPPVDRAYLAQYAPYLLTGEIADGESYTYGSRLNYERLSKGEIDEVIRLKNIIFRDHCGSDELGKIIYQGKGLSQVDLAIEVYREFPRTNQMCLQVAKPKDMLLIDPPCLRHIDTRLQDGKLHFYPYFRSWDLYCIDEKSEILTKDGWKGKDEVNIGDMVASLNEYLNVIEYVPVKNKILQKYEGDMFRVLNKRVDQLITPDHRILHKYITHSGSKRIVKELTYTKARDLEVKDGSQIPVCAECRENEWYMGMPKASLIGWILTDSYYRKKCDTIEIYQSEKKYADEIRKLLTDLDIDFIEKSVERTFYKICNKEYPDGIKTQCTTFTIPARCSKWIKEIIPNRLPVNSLLHLPYVERYEIFMAMIKGDGSIRSDTNFCFYSKIKKKREWFQLLAFSLGFRTIINNKKGYVNCSKEYDFSTLQRNHFENNKLPVEEYNGYVWCIETLNRNFVMRRNDKISITGNSGFPANVAGISMLQEHMSNEIGVKQGEMICTSKGLHLYDYTFSFAEARCLFE